MLYRKKHSMSPCEYYNDDRIIEERLWLTRKLFNDVSVLLENSEHFTFHEAKIIGVVKDLCVGHATMQHQDSEPRIEDGDKELRCLAQCFHKPLYYRYQYLQQHHLPDDVLLDRTQGDAVFKSWRQDFKLCSSKRNVFWAVA